MSVQALRPDLAAIAALIPAFDVDESLLPTFQSGDVPAPVSSESVQRYDVAVPGEPELLVRVARPRVAPQPLPALIYMHGGGYVFGNRAMDDERVEPWAARGIVVLSVEHRLAPQTPYPGPLEDCYRALNWVHEQALELGVDRKRVGVGGLSAGAGLAAALALLARDRGEIEVAFQLLESPMLDDRQVTRSSQRDDLLMWSRASNAFGWRSYLGDLYGQDDVPATAVPGRAADLSGLPPTLVAVGSEDGFLDEDVEFALRLQQAGVPVELHVYDGACHGFQSLGPNSAAEQAAHDTARFLVRRTALLREAVTP